MMKQSLIQIDPWACFLGALLLLTMPLNWLIAAACAAAFHEICHVLAIRMTKGTVCRVRIGAGGAVMDAEAMDPGQELLCALAGPVGSFSLVLLCRYFPRLSICAGIQGIFNLLPLGNLDGGRVLRCCMELFFPRQAQWLGTALQWTAVICLTAAVLLTGWASSLGMAFWIPAAFLFGKALLRKRPCKPCQIRVQ